ncbi:DeoR/GlpR family DNA-binding transcription regulator [Paenibacillus antibioticophila]|uniref:DeoR/GlpR family DNA-binding transcription regulator n=1 Tax=Paenibacillus antibioticophila TaxID=1274374 RepID=UPI0005C971FC|nr:DeoR/GlpR family DNA-binding transcription regulator [Paenibacillus antibioticophila]
MKARHRVIVAYLKEHTFLHVNTLAELLEVSLPTIRRDLHEMELEGYIQRVNGGAFLKSAGEGSGEAAAKGGDPLAAHKKAIAAEVVKWIEPGDTLFIDSGSTTGHVADLLTELKDITIVTNSIDIAYKCMRKPNLSVFVCGGTAEDVQSESGIVGPLAEQMISQFRANLCILGTAGLDPRQGITDPYLSVARIKEKMFSYSARRILVTDHSKFGKIHKAFVAPIESFDCLITDWEASEQQLEGVRRRGIQVKPVSNPGDVLP